MSNKINNNTNRDSKSNLRNLSTSTPLQSLEAKAARAAIIAQTERSLNKTMGTTSSVQLFNKRKQRTLTGLERQLNVIRSAFERANLDRTEVRISKPAVGSSAVCVITTWKKDACTGGRNKIRVWHQDEEDKPAKKSGEKKPERTYVFYPSSTDLNCLGSVAIYGSDVVEDYEPIHRKGHLFGIEVRAVTVEMGRRAFLDVTFRA